MTDKEKHEVIQAVIDVMWLIFALALLINIFWTKL